MTYLNSGNVSFSSDMDDKIEISEGKWEKTGWFIGRVFH